MKKEEQVSIIVPVYNSERTIKKCVYSIINQSYKNCEIILINDGSTDSSLEICKMLEIKYDNIKVINKNNEGVSAARNDGIKESNGYYVMFIDSDDTVEYDYIESMIESIKINNAEMSICGYKKVYNNKTIEIIIDNYDREIRRIDLETIMLLSSTSLLAHVTNKLFIKEYIYKGFSEELTLGEDFLFVLNYLDNISTISYLNKAFYNYIIHENENSLNKTFREDLLDVSYHINSIFKEFLLKKCTKEEKINGFINKCIYIDLIMSLRKLSLNKTISYTKKIEIIQKWIMQENTMNILNSKIININIKTKIINALILKGYFNLVILYFHLEKTIKFFRDKMR